MKPPHERIVIPIGQQSPSVATARPSGRWRKVLLFLGLLCATIAILLIAGVFLWWQYYKTTPAYSLALVVEAAQRGDAGTIEALIDVDSIGDNLISQVTGRAGISVGEGITSTLRRQVERVAPSVVVGVKQSIREAIMLRLKEVAARAENKPFLLTAVALPFIVDITNHGDSASVVATFQNRPVELRMRRRGDVWQITEVHDDVALQRVVEEILKKSPGRLGILNQ
ncbi:MAG TPA: hypothetical protein VMM84_14910 [Pyrinomonadaceae bacterium]|nr:hypothetical protein [Pyrinomonadaceae bacterium]